MKKFNVTLLLLLSMATNVFAFNFPEPDWGSLLNQRRSLVNQVDFELYTEAPPETSVYYGAKFEPRGGAYLGMVGDTSRFGHFGSYLTYIESMDQGRPYGGNVPNSVTMVGWTVNSLDEVDYDKIRATLENLNSFGSPVFVRFANEMNVSSLGDDPDRYVSIFRNVANMIHEYPNLAVVWSPNDMGALDRPFDYYYPGDEYVDWVGVSLYTRTYFAGNNKTTENDSIFFMTGPYGFATNTIKPIMQFMEKKGINKPVMISEGGVANDNKYHDVTEDWTDLRMRNFLWYLVMKYPQIKMINYFNTKINGESEIYYMSDNQFAVDTFNEAYNYGPYIKNQKSNSDYVFAKAERGETLVADDDGIVNLYTLCYYPKTTDLTVSYSVDEQWIGASKKVPYKFKFDINQVSDGKHTMTISCANGKKNYTFYKRGRYICFNAEPDTTFPVKYPKDKVKVTVNGNHVSFDEAPVIKNGRTLVPLRAIFEKLGADVNWDENTKTITASRSGVNVKLQIDSNVMDVNGYLKKELEVSATIINSRTFVPVRAISEAFSCNVEWDDGTRTVIIKE